MIFALASLHSQPGQWNLFCLWLWFRSEFCDFIIFNLATASHKYDYFCCKFYDFFSFQFSLLFVLFGKQNLQKYIPMPRSGITFFTEIRDTKDLFDYIPTLMRLRPFSHHSIRYVVSLVDTWDPSMPVNQTLSILLFI